MWSQHHRTQWPDLDERQLRPTKTGRLASGGFVLADPFDTQLRLVSVEYLRAAWQRLDGVLTQYHLHPVDLSWGGLHSGESHIAGIHPPAPSDYVGWTSQELARFWEDPRYLSIDEQLQRDLSTPPTLRCAQCYRSLKWRIDPEEYPLALRLIEAIATDEIGDWTPAVMLAQQAGMSFYGPITAQEFWLQVAKASQALDQQRVDQEPWLQMAQAIQAGDQKRLDKAVRAAQSAYTGAGFRIVVRGFGAYLSQPGRAVPLHLPDLSSS